MKISIERELTEEFLTDVMVTAFDGAYGGCWYWARPADLPNGMAFVIRKGKTTPIHDVWEKVVIVDQEDPLEQHSVTHETIILGMKRIIDGNVPISEELRDYVFKAMMDCDAGDVDSTVADCIVQAGLFEELVYG